jgi:hypothetical protein
MKTTKIPKLKPEEKEMIIRNHFQKLEGEKKITEVLTKVVNRLMLAFLAVCNVIAGGIFFVVALKTKSSFFFLMAVSAIITSIMVSFGYINSEKKTKKRN